MPALGDRVPPAVAAAALKLAQVQRHRRAVGQVQMQRVLVHLAHIRGFLHALH